MLSIESIGDMIAADRVCDRVGGSVNTGDGVADIDDVANRGYYQSFTCGPHFFFVYGC